MWRQNGDHLDWPLGLRLQSWIPFPQRTTLTQLNISEICFLHGYNNAMIPKGLVHHLGGCYAKPYSNQLEAITQHWEGRLRRDTTSLSVLPHPIVLVALSQHACEVCEVLPHPIVLVALSHHACEVSEVLPHPIVLVALSQHACEVCEVLPHPIVLVALSQHTCLFLVLCTYAHTIAPIGLGR